MKWIQLEIQFPVPEPRYLAGIDPVPEPPNDVRYWGIDKGRVSYNHAFNHDGIMARIEELQRREARREALLFGNESMHNRFHHNRVREIFEQRPLRPDECFRTP